jgi:hypothetical protein
MILVVALGRRTARSRRRSQRPRAEPPAHAGVETASIRRAATYSSAGGRNSSNRQIEATEKLLAEKRAKEKAVGSPRGLCQSLFPPAADRRWCCVEISLSGDVPACPARGPRMRQGRRPVRERPRCRPAVAALVWKAPRISP